LKNIHKVYSSQKKDKVMPKLSEDVVKGHPENIQKTAAVVFRKTPEGTVNPLSLMQSPPAGQLISGVRGFKKNYSTPNKAKSKVCVKSFPKLH
jgi:hypothetical protein